jgi:glycosyltransferase involved in cell wall biosynthesis
VALRARRKHRVIADVDDLLVAQAKAAGTGSLILKLLELVELGIPRRLKHVTVNSRYLNAVFPRAVKIPNMIPTADFQLNLGDTEKNAIKTRYGIDEKTIAFVSTVTLYHGHFDLLNAIAEHNRKFVFVGGGEGEARLRAEIRRNGLDGKIVCTGPLPHDEVIRILNVVRVGILPMSNSPVHLARHPLKLLEYMAAGLCVVASRVGEAEELLREGAGVLVESGDMDALIREACAVEHPEQYSKAAMDTVRRFDVERVTEDWQALYERVLQTA